MRRWPSHAGAAPAHVSGRVLRYAVAALGLSLVALPLLRSAEPHRQVAVLVRNEASDTVLVDARWWAGPVGLAGPVAVRLRPRAETLILHPGYPREVCIRVIDPHTGRVGSGLVASDVADDTVRVVVHQSSLEPPVAVFAAPCPPWLGDDRVWIGLDRYLDLHDPQRIRRDRLIRRY
jgi:hypothetical protein